jgi:O-antigen ligase
MSWPIAMLTVFAAVVLYVAIPESSAFGLVMMTGVPLWWMMYRTGTLPPVSRTLGMLALISLGAWMALSALWAASPMAAIHIASTMVLYAVCADSWVHFSRANEPVLHPRLGWALLVGFVLTSLFVCFEAATNQMVRTALANASEAFRPGPQHMTIDATGRVTINAYVMNRQIAAVMFLIWPVLLVGHCLLPERWRWPVVAGLSIVTIATVIVGFHASSRLALGVSIAVFLVALWRWTVAHRGAMVLWTVLTLLIVPIAALSFQLELYKIKQLPYSSAHRLVIWGHTASQAMQRPLIGIGAAATRYVDRAEMHGPPRVVRTARHVIPVGVNAHAHNVYLQVWYEAGAVGAVLLWLAGMPVIGWINKANARLRPGLLATWGSAVAMASTSYSLTDPWFMASFGLAAVFSLLAVAVDGHRNRSLAIV